MHFEGATVCICPEISIPHRTMWFLSENRPFVSVSPAVFFPFAFFCVIFHEIHTFSPIIYTVVKCSNVQAANTFTIAIVNARQMHGSSTTKPNVFAWNVQQVALSQTLAVLCCVSFWNWTMAVMRKRAITPRNFIANLRIWCHVREQLCNSRCDLETNGSNFSLTWFFRRFSKHSKRPSANWAHWIVKRCTAGHSHRWFITRWFGLCGNLRKGS